MIGSHLLFIITAKIAPRLDKTSGLYKRARLSAFSGCALTFYPARAVSCQVVNKGWWVQQRDGVGRTGNMAISLK